MKRTLGGLAIRPRKGLERDLYICVWASPPVVASSLLFHKKWKMYRKIIVQKQLSFEDERYCQSDGRHCRATDDIFKP